VCYNPPRFTVTPLTRLALLHAGLLAYAASILSGAFAVARNHRPALSAARLLLLPGVLLHSLLLLGIAVQDGRFPIANLSEAILLLSTVLVLTALAVDLQRALPVIPVAIAPIAAVTILWSAVLAPAPGRLPAPETLRFWTALHVLITLAAFVAFSLGFVCGALFLVEQRRLKQRTAPSFLRLLPSLESLNGMLLAALSCGTLLLTLGILIGYLDARNLHAGREWRLDPKILCTTTTWAGYAVVLGLSLLPSWKGRRTALGAVVCFPLVALTLWGSVFWSDFHRFA